MTKVSAEDWKPKRVREARGRAVPKRDIYSTTNAILPSSLGSFEYNEQFERNRRDYHLIVKDGEQNYARYFFEALAYDLLNWVKATPEAKKVSEYYTSRNIRRTTWYKWVKKHEVLREAHNFAVEVIGIYLWKNSLEGSYKENSVFKAMPMYDPDFKALDEWRSKLGLTDQQRDAVYNIVMSNLGRKKDEDHKTPEINKDKKAKKDL